MYAALGQTTCPDPIMFREPDTGKCWCPPPYLDIGGKCKLATEVPATTKPTTGRCSDPIMFQGPQGKCWCPPPYLEENGVCYNPLTVPSGTPVPGPAPAPQPSPEPKTAGLGSVTWIALAVGGMAVLYTMGKQSKRSKR